MRRFQYPAKVEVNIPQLTLVDWGWFLGLSEPTRLIARAVIQVGHSAGDEWLAAIELPEPITSTMYTWGW